MVKAPSRPPSTFSCRAPACTSLLCPSSEILLSIFNKCVYMFLHSSLLDPFIAVPALVWFFHSFCLGHLSVFRRSFLIPFAAVPYSILWTLYHSLLVGIGLVPNHTTSVRTQRNDISSWDSHRHAEVASPVKGISFALLDPSSSSMAWARDCPSLSLSFLICKVGMLTVPVSGHSEEPS